MKRNTMEKKRAGEDVLCALAMLGAAAVLLALRCGAAVWPYLY